MQQQKLVTARRQRQRARQQMRSVQQQQRSSKMCGRLTALHLLPSRGWKLCSVGCVVLSVQFLLRAQALTCVRVLLSGGVKLSLSKREPE